MTKLQRSVLLILKEGGYIDLPFQRAKIHAAYDGLGAFRMTLTTTTVAAMIRHGWIKPTRYEMDVNLKMAVGGKAVRS
jgi:hypothetical protein